MNRKIIIAFLASALVACSEKNVKSEMPGPEVKVESVLGVPTFTINGTPYLKPAFETYQPEEKYFEQFSLAGTDVYSFNTNVSACDYGHSKPLQPEKGVFDFSGFNERMDRVLAADSNALVIPRINLGTAPWWLNENPDEMEILDHGSPIYKSPNENPTVPQGRPFPSIVSERWREYIGNSLRTFIDYIKTHPVYKDHIFGFFIAGLDTEEWYHWSSGSSQLSGYSSHMEKAFKKWLKEKYVTNEALSKAWNREGITFDQVKVPTKNERYDINDGMFRDPLKKMNVIDFYMFYNDIIPQTIDYFAQIVKDETDRKKAVGAFYGYMYEFRGDPEYGHNALDKFNKSENLDFIFVTASYENRIPGLGGDYSRAPATSVKLHNKLWYHDNDVCSFLAPEVLKKAGFSDDSNWDRNLTHHLKALGYTETAEKTKWMYRRSMGFALCNGAFESFFDLHGGYYDHPELMDEVKTLNRVAEAAAEKDRSSVADVLIISDEPSCSYATFRNQFLGESLLYFQHNVIKAGFASPDHILLSDLDKVDPDKYKLVIFLNCYNIDDSQRRTINSSFKRNNKTLLWCYAPGYFNGNVSSVDAMNKLVSFNLKPYFGSEFISPQIDIVDSDYWTESFYETLSQKRVGSKSKSCESIVVDDNEAHILGYLSGSKQVALAYKKLDGWNSLYSLTSLLSPEVLRQIAKKSGVHIFNDKNDTFYANKSYISIHANGDGLRIINFPSQCDVYDIVTGEKIGSNTDKIKLNMQSGETLLLQY